MLYPNIFRKEKVRMTGLNNFHRLMAAFQIFKLAQQTSH
jgi:hypothetical protein